jgi:hypothetical protein
LALVALGTVGMCIELVLLEHYRDPNQLIPLSVGGVTLLIVMWAAIAPGIVAVRTLQFAMLVYVGCAIVGGTLHLQADVEAPALAPGLMAQLGLLGLLATYQHPVLIEPDR